MLHEMSIENLGVISRTRVEFSPGLTVITGETGAGKTMILSGLGLLMGGKADAQVVRTGTDAAVVEGRVVADSASLAARVDETGAVLDDDGSLLIVRTVAAQGRSRTHLGGRSVPQAVLADLAEDLVTIHGQSDQMRLRSPQRQREALDSFAGEVVTWPSPSTGRCGTSVQRPPPSSRSSSGARRSAPARPSCSASASPRSSG